MGEFRTTLDPASPSAFFVCEFLVRFVDESFRVPIGTKLVIIVHTL